MPIIFGIKKFENYTNVVFKGHYVCFHIIVHNGLFDHASRKGSLSILRGVMQKLPNCSQCCYELHNVLTPYSVHGEKRQRYLVSDLGLYYLLDYGVGWGGMRILCIKMLDLYRNDTLP